MRVRSFVSLSSCLFMLGCGSVNADSFADPGSLDDSGEPVTDSATADASATDTRVASDGGVDSTKSSEVDSGKSLGDTSTTIDDTGIVTLDTSIPLDTSILDVLPDVPLRVCTVATARIFGGHCYFRIESHNYADSKSGCASFSAATHLVTINSDGEQKFASTFGVGLERWIGLAKDFPAPTSKASFKWITGEPVTFDGWATDEPNGSGSCARLLASNDWADSDCFSSHTAICEEE